MAVLLTAPELANKIPELYSAEISKAIHALLESRHLYQSTEVKSESVSSVLKDQVDSSDKQYVFNACQRLKNVPWLVDDMTMDAVFKRLAGPKDQYFLQWRAPDIKIFCKRCERLEPYNLAQSNNLLSQSDPYKGGVFQGGVLYQVYALMYVCQSCKAVPEVFMVARASNKLTLSGRAPMEHVWVPNFIPKEVAKYYSGAVVAHQAGQTLASLFLLRTVCEQWARKYSDTEDKADVAIDKYMEGLPDDFKARFPSIRTIYSDLSLALHAANDSSELYESVTSRLRDHFEARKVFKLA